MNDIFINDELRTAEQIREHYEIEKELASRLLNSSKAERRYLYTNLYNELYQRVSHHPQLTKKMSPEDSLKDVNFQMQFLKSFLRDDTSFLEIGAGDCALSFEVARYTKQVYAVDVSDEITKCVSPPANFKLFLSEDGCSIPVQENCIDVAYSNQLMEHLHPDDAYEQLRNIYNTLVPGGVYICITPNRLTGPHDISMYFDRISTGFHLKEYTFTDLTKLFRKAGFSKVRTYKRVKGKHMAFSVLPILCCETLLSLLPYAWRKYLSQRQPLKNILKIRIVGIK